MAAKRVSKRKKTSKRPKTAKRAKPPKRRKRPPKRPKRPKRPKHPRRPHRPRPRPHKPPRHSAHSKPDTGADSGAGGVAAGACGLIRIDDSIGQEQVNWCWAACVEVVVRFRNNPVPQLQQCDVATAAIGAGMGCCTLRAVECLSSQGGASSGPCDVPRTTTQITALFNSYGIRAWEDVRITEATLRSDLSAAVPKIVGVHITWNAGTGHMLLIYGCASDTMFNVYDPCVGAQTLTYNQIVNYGDGEGNWDLSWRDL